MTKTKTTVKNLYCPKCSTTYDINTVINLCRCGSPLLVNYDYEQIPQILTKEKLKSRLPSMWKYEEVLPVQDRSNIISLSEGATPLLQSRTIGKELGCLNLFFKDETVNPTGSFKARGLAVAVSRAKELGLEKLIIPTAGNAGSALAAYAACAQMKCYIIMPADTPLPFITECEYYGAKIELIDGSIKDCGKRAADIVDKQDWFSLATLKEPYRIEGKKTMGYEISEYFNFSLPDVIIYPTGGGTGLIGMWKAFNELEKIGWLNGSKPKMIAVQSEGCAPIVKAFKENKNNAEIWKNPVTIAVGLKVPGAIGDFLILKAIKKSGGLAIAVSDKEIMTATREIASKEGIFSSPEGGATLAALKKLIKMNYIKTLDKVILFITGSGYKYIDILL